LDVPKVLAEDVAPNRLIRASKLQIINQLGSDQIGIAAYAGSVSFPVLPITTDYSSG
jgi:Ca-activated chloride channel family protein